MYISDRAKKIKPFYVMELLEKAKELESRGEDIIHMEIGEPDFATPGPVKDAAIEAIKSDHAFYTHSLGLPELREKVAEYYLNNDGIEIPPEKIIMTDGTSGAFFLLFAALLDRGKSLGIPDPGYPCYKNFGHLVDAENIPINVSEKTNFEITVDQLSDLTRNPDILIISNPSNPTGAVYKHENIGELFRHLKSKGSLLIVDEIYSGLSYGRKIKSALSIAENIIVVNGFSKTYAMTGWRLGWMVVPSDLVRPIQKIAQNVFISPPTISQHAALKVFGAVDELESMRKTYQKRRDFLLPELRRLGFKIPVKPEGAFYIYTGIEKWGIDSMEFVERALVEAKVALTPGHDFGSNRAGSHVRFSYANHLDRLKEGCKRLEKWLNEL
jgi:aspartate/methionine/tyrosine aminotransferase